MAKTHSRLMTFIVTGGICLLGGPSVGSAQNEVPPPPAAQDNAAGGVEEFEPLEMDQIEPLDTPAQDQADQNLDIPDANQNLSTASSSGAQSISPNMIGDFFGTAGGGNSFFLVQPPSLEMGPTQITLDPLDAVFSNDPATVTLIPSNPPPQGPTSFPQVATFNLNGGTLTIDGNSTNGLSFGSNVQAQNNVEQINAGNYGPGTVISLANAAQDQNGNGLPDLFESDPATAAAVNQLISDATDAALMDFLAENGGMIIQTINGPQLVLGQPEATVEVDNPDFDGGGVDGVGDTGTITENDEFSVEAAGTLNPGTFLFQADGEVVPDPIEIFIVGNGNLAGAPGAVVGRSKLGENSNPLPRDRVFVNYSYFNNTPLAPGGVDVNRVTPGFEKTFFDGNMSFELRTPFATTLDSDVNGGVLNTSHTEFGNLTGFFKALLTQDDEFALSAGLGFTAPTADDARVRTADGTNLLVVDNKSVHLLPFVGALWTPTERFFASSFIQLDIDANGNPVSVTGFDAMSNPSGELTQIGRPHDFTLMFLDFSAGYWTYLDPNGTGTIRGIAPIVELHHNQSLGNGDSTRGVVDGAVWSFDAPEGISTTNAVLGLTSIIGDSGTLTAAYAVPLSHEDAQFDGEFRLFFNWYFGSSRPTTRATRAPAF